MKFINHVQIKDNLNSKTFYFHFVKIVLYFISLKDLFLLTWTNDLFLFSLEQKQCLVLFGDFSIKDFFMMSCLDN